MQKVIVSGECRAQLVEVADPQPKEDWALVKVMATPMCTEYKAYRSGQRAEYLGHEAVGEVVAVAQPCRVKPGDRVVVQPTYPCGRCRHCVSGNYIYCEDTYNFAEFIGSREGSATYAQYLLKPSWLLSPIPDDVSWEHAGAALCGLGPSYGAFDAIGLNAYDTVLITGLGPVGLGAVVNARYRGARVIAVESAAWRAERALAMGATAVIDPQDERALARIRDLTDGGRGVDAALDCSGTVAAQRLCIDAAARRGRVAFVGECWDQLQIGVSNDMLRKGLTLVGSWHYNLAAYAPIMQVIRQSPLIDLLISHVMPMCDVERAFALQMAGRCAKIILKPWD
jgi:threonine dehydrogenase-like Zn-dependent dehydrogenase